MSLFTNSRFQNIEPGQSDRLLAQIAISSDKVLILKNVPDPNGKNKPKQVQIAALTGEEVNTFLKSIRLNDKELKPLDRDFQYRIRFQRGKSILGGVNVYLHRDWAYLQEPKDELDSPFEGTRVLQPTYAPRLEKFLTSLEK